MRGVSYCDCNRSFFYRSLGFRSSDRRFAIRSYTILKGNPMNIRKYYNFQPLNWCENWGFIRRFMNHFQQKGRRFRGKLFS